jgi:hypothetical protein
MTTNLRSSFYLLAAWVLLTIPAGAQTTTQTFQLRSGWNSIWLELEPTNTATDAVFAGLPLSKVWTYAPRNSTVQFIQEQTEALLNQPGWLPYFPPTTPESILTSLYNVHAQRAYLVKLTNAATLTVTGVPVVRTARWVTDSYNLRGFAVNPGSPPSFAVFLGASPAHAGQPVYQLQSNGQWQLISATSAINPGEAYWVFCSGASTYSGPVSLELEIGESLDFSSVLTELAPTVRNSSGAARTICLRDLFNGANNPLAYHVFANNQFQWTNLPSPYCFSVNAASATGLRFAMRRTAFVGTNYSSIIEITDDLGTRHLVALNGQKLLPARASLSGSAAAFRSLLTPQPLDAAGATTNLAAGLWVGTATITNVNEANSANPLAVTPTRSPFDLRLLVHVDLNGNVWLLKDVIQMWQNGTTTNDANGHAVTDQPGRYVLLTDDSLIPQYQGASLRDGVPVGRRISTVDFDFDGGTSNILAMTGAFSIGATNRCTFVLDPNLPTNPFKHRFHPDHDNLDATYTQYKEEAYRVTRAIELRFSPTDPAGTNTTSSLDYGYNLIGGIYHENITGLHRTNIVSEGTFRLTRVSNSPVLNQ